MGSFNSDGKDANILRLGKIFHGIFSTFVTIY